MPTTYGRALAGARNAQNLSQAALAVKAHMAQSTIAKWETGDRTPTGYEEVFVVETALFGAPNGELSRHLGFIPAGATSHIGVLEAIRADPLLNEAAQRALVVSYEAFTVGSGQPRPSPGRPRRRTRQ